MPDENIGFKVGDVVCFNSGGHPMTIIFLDENFATCVWSAKGDSKSKSYPVEALKQADVNCRGEVTDARQRNLKLIEQVATRMPLREEDHSEVAGGAVRN